MPPAWVSLTLFATPPYLFWQVVNATLRILTELPYVGSSWSSCFCSAICRGP